MSKELTLSKLKGLRYEAREFVIPGFEFPRETVQFAYKKLALLWITTNKANNLLTLEGNRRTRRELSIVRLLYIENGLELCNL